MLTRFKRGRVALRRHDEGGAIAILTAFMCIVLFGVAALSVDLGNAFARRTDTQTQADFGALAAARMQTQSATSGMTISTEMKDAVRDAMNNNQPQDDTSGCWTTKTCVTSAELTDNDLTNGELRFCAGTACGSGYASTVKGLQVLAPANKVDYGFANLLGVASGTVNARALVNVFTAGKRVMPMYAVQGCDYGLQTLADPANNITSPMVPTTLAHAGDTGSQNNLIYNQTTAPYSPTLIDSSGATVTALALNSTGNKVQVDASRWRDLTAIGFFRDNGTAPTQVTTLGLSPAVTGITTPYTANTGSRIALDVPDSVATIGEVWWIRALDSSGKWSQNSEALPIRVGDAVLQCASGSTVGNFGTLKFPRTDVPTAQQIPANIATGLQAPLFPVVHQWAIDNPNPGTCVDGVNEAQTAPSGGVTLINGVNCVDTDTGLSANVATQGLVQGGSYGPGVLTTQNTRTGCAPGGGSSNRSVSIGPTTYSINNDRLTCFFTNGSTSILNITQENYAGPAVLDPSILSNPRFFYVPVLAIQPMGGSNRYSIVDFRAAFITDETATMTAVRGSDTGTSNNGMVFQGQDFKQLKVVFFNDAALPSEGDIPIIDYLGVGTRVIRLID